ncbi:MAG: LysR family transcriptional regulator [Maricaulis sp.]|jgi:DNA-binding transcriptional LysR family regulator|nr:LysR family transcriptional regulator [Maricaulis sp.]
MNKLGTSFDWNQIRAFLATVEEGSLSAAARALGQTQPTLSRQITALEKSLGVTLFERGHRSMDLTGPGLELMDDVRAMGEAAGRISLTASGRSQAIEGEVTITATNMMATYFLPPVLAALREEAPQIEIEIIASNDVRDLKKREADIAIRHARPEQPDLICKLLRETQGQLYASKQFLEQHGRPQTVEELAKLDFIGFEQNDLVIAAFAEIGLMLTPASFRLSSGSGTVTLELMRRGLGVGMLTRDIADFHPELELALPSLPSIPVPVWLVTHRELHTSRRIRLVFDRLADALS